MSVLNALEHPFILAIEKLVKFCRMEAKENNDLFLENLMAFGDNSVMDVELSTEKDGEKILLGKKKVSKG